MKVSESMIDDWVICNHYVDKPYYKQVDITDFCKGNLVYCEPITVTGDILVKNGFEKQGDLYMYHIDAGDGYLRIDLVDLHDGLWSYDIDSYDKFNDSLETHRNDSTFLKLHQLQHLLHFCGIEKELII